MEENNSRRNNLICIVFILLTIPFIKPVGFAECFGWFNKLFQLWKVVSLAVIAAYFLYKFRFRKLFGIVNPGFVGLFIYSAIVLFHSALDSVAVFETFNNVLSDIVLLFAGIYIMQSEEGPIFRRALNIVISVDLLIHVTTTFVSYVGTDILVKNSFTHYLYLGGENYSGFTLIPIMGVMFYLDLQENSRLFEIKGFAIGILLGISYLKTGSLTVTACILGLIVIIAIGRFFPRFAKVFIPEILLGLIIVGLILVIKFSIQDHLEDFFKFLDQWHHGSFYAVDGVGESNKITLNNRIFVWPAAVELIKNNLWLGHGIMSEAEPALFWEYRHAHNIFLDLLINSGIVGTLGYLWFMVYPLRILRSKELYETSKYLILALFVFIGLSSMDCYPHMQPQFIMYMCIYYEITKEKQ